MWKWLCMVALGMVGLYSCRSRDKVILVKTTLQNHTQISKLHGHTLKHLGQLSDSGTLYGHYLNFADTLLVLFQNEDNMELWFNKLLSDNNALFKQTLGILEQAENHGLENEFYHVGFLNSALQSIQKNRWDSIVPYDSLSMLMVLSADAVMGFYSNMQSGRIDPSYTGSLDVLPRRRHGLLLPLILEDSTFPALKYCIPKFMEYRFLQKEYMRVKNSRNPRDGKALYLGRMLRPGDSLAFLSRRLAERLKLFGYYSVEDSNIHKIKNYNWELMHAVELLQAANGLEVSGNVDYKTRLLLQTTKDEMLISLRANLERWRWLGVINEHSYVWANIGENKVYAFKNDSLKVEMKICSGKSRDTAYYNKLERAKKDQKLTAPDNLETPLMKAEMTHMVVNPSWFVPKNIMIKELLPQLKTDRSILTEKNYILRNYKGEEIDPNSIDWSQVTEKNWKYGMEQLPGEENALGKIVIHFPNKYSIFMHDTPSKFAFEYKDRHVSHGCMRMEEPLKMAEFLSSFNKKNNIDEIYIAAGMEPVLDEKKIKKYQEDMKDSVRAAKLKPKPNRYFKNDKSIPVYLVYFTCSVNSAGKINYFFDSYNRDKKMLSEMKRPSKKVRKTKVNSQQVFSP
ncbi:MAG: L,D-transpeptidase family protein [Bacteroidetes bacterium]|nr:L,D-transpeptidase family protein [Bacteroidota bacterium]